MFTTLFSATLFVALAVQGAFADFTIDTPSFVQCTDAQITWTQSVAPYNLLIVPADDVCGDALADLGDQTGLSTTYTVALASGTQVVLSLEDADGNEAWSGTVTVASSSDSSCLTASTPTTYSGTTLSLANTAAAASPTTSTFSPAGAANAGLDPTSGAMSIRPFSALPTIGFLAFVAFIL
ncbi:hypothetical protein K503DRAFT_857447 [Rhizopogon vinicolor AM-OR11-026]|uniref:Uncharacterized protein n=1 Tax=Rhizopogon vinicolor AM-OR11-026 TaxID=1314800 RepID=A0A1B7MXG5_9AGAM|nr:hypothetical protein K503DRAFT_857447 [Rhizopogon vinicolor AM-OR11-026]